MSQPSVKKFFKPTDCNSNERDNVDHFPTADFNAAETSANRKRRAESNDLEQQAPPIKMSSQSSWVNKTEIMSIKDICDNADKWVVLEVSEKTGGHKSTMYESKAGLPPDLSKCWPFMDQIKLSDILVTSPRHFETGGLLENFADENREGIKPGCDRVVGLLCSTCRQNYPNSELGNLFNKNGLVFINVPRSAPFGSIREILKLHEFGRKVKGDLWKCGPIKLREKFINGEVDKNLTSSTTRHMRFQMEDRSRKEVHDKNSRPDVLLNRKVCLNMGNSKDAVTVLFANALKLIKSRTSVFTNLRSELEFQRQFGSSEPIKFLVDTLQMHYTCPFSIDQIVDSLDLARHYGVLQDLFAHRPEGEDPSFGALLDCGSGQAHFREFVGFDIKMEDQEGNMVCRVLGFPATDRKTGFHLLQKFEGLVTDFNR